MSTREFFSAVILSLIINLSGHSQVFNMVVSKTGPGTYPTIQKAIDKVTDNKATRTIIFIKNGIYTEKVNIPSSKFVSLIGESTDGVRISYNDYSGKVVGSVTLTTATSYTLWVQSDNFYAENLTIRNTSGNVGQAVAVRTTGDRQIFNNCRFLGFQDTYYANSKSQYNINCYIEGATDFIFGDATVVFDNCTINCVNGGHYISAPADTKLISKKASGDTLFHGILFRNCTLTANSDVSAGSYYLGRPWKDFASSVYINCKMGNHIKQEGWSVWTTSGDDADNHLTGCYAEYKSKNLSDVLIDTSLRVYWSRQLSDSDVMNYYNLDTFFFKNNIVWNPFPIEEEPFAPKNLTIDNFQLTWTMDSSYKGFVIIRNDASIGFSINLYFTDTTANSQVDNNYYVKTVSNRYGNLSEASNEVEVNGEFNKINRYTNISFQIKVINKYLILTESADIEIYTILGTLIKRSTNTKSISLEDLNHGLYMVKAIKNKNEIVVKKVVL